MYLRLPWIVGQAGLYTTIGIVLVAHLISVTTGLSISSIATDKKVQAGGNYYIISRSLGLPIGGTLGIALFFGLSLSVSLYIIGFSESFLGFWGLEVSKKNIRIAGTLAIAAVTTITFISTSLAIKTQYFIMTAIGLSLISILLGKSDLAPAQPLLWPLETSAPVMVLFGIFFPAVTGFEAGVSMSGDLRDPKKSIPGGTLSAIVVGLLVYVGLPFFFSFRVEPDALVNNPNVLLDLSFFWPLVVAGIWGATISSAMGSILGAPRILQATSVDRITPRVFAKGYGSLNEPRNALLLTFAIAEVGILIGELNIIARVVSIFFITAYGFLNLSCAIENWASTDFRPAFKIPTWVSIIGSIACFLVMIELDLLVLVAGTIIMGAVFLYLTNKELTLESGDTWEGVWSSVIRSGLNRITRGTSHRRNWRPNVILFSGGSGARPHLVELGKWIVHKRGILSSFHLHEDPRAKVLFSKSQQTLRDDQDFPGLFSRKMECRDIYEGMETIARVYGFSGIDPNMVMMGWARDGGKSEGYAGLLQQLMSLDYNLLLLDYDEELGFGKQERIDIWWRGANNNASLALMLLKFLTASEAWQKSKARLLIISEDSNIINKLYRNTNRLLADQRIEAEVKVINNAIEKRPVAEIIRMESSDADLIVLGMPDVLPENVARYTADTNSLIDDLGTVLLVYASSYFEAPYIGLADVTLDGRRAHPDEEATWGAGQPEMVYPAQEELAVHLRTLHSRVESVMHEYRTGFLQAVHELNREFITELRSLSEDYFKALRNHWSDGDHPRFPRHFARVQSDMLFQSRRLFRKYKTDTLPIQAQNLEHGIEFVLSKLTALPGEFPGEVPVYYEPEYSEPRQGDSLSLRALKLRKRMARRLLGRPARMKLDIRRLADYFVAVPVRRGIYEQLQSFGTASYRLNSEIQKWFSMARDAFMAIERRLQQKELSAGMIEEEGRRLVERLQDIAGHHNAEAREIYRELLRHIRESMQQLSGELGGLEARRRILRRLRIPGASRELLSTLERAPALWNKNLSLVTHFSELELALMVGLNRLDTIMDRRSKELLLSIDNNALSVLSELRAALEAFSRELAADPAAAFRWAFDELRLFDGDSAAQDLLADLQDATEELPESIDIISEESFQDIETRQFEEVEVVTVALRRLVDYLLETELVNPIRAEAARAASQLEESLNQVQDITRLICYTSAIGGTGEDRGGHDTDGALPAMVRNALKRFGEEEERIRQVRQDLMEAFQRRLAAAFEKMNPYVLVRGAQSLGQYMRAHEGRRVLSQVEIKSR
ncbi:MAG: amino acid permease, partial [Acidobacteria bacterium]|nr:amino acid permease [Acidobacteriota bacterium]